MFIKILGNMFDFYYVPIHLTNEVQKLGLI